MAPDEHQSGSIMTWSTIRHLRFPFSWFLSPTAVLALALLPSIDVFKACLGFFILHILTYPASNGFNSYYDRDEGSIGGMKTPPPVTKDLLWTALVMDALSLLLGLFIGIGFTIFLFVYGMLSKAYSWDRTRLKRMPFVSWLGTGLFQGAGTFLMMAIAASPSGINIIKETPVLLAAGLSSLYLWASYPMTQVYQHKEDMRRGDRTLSILLGVKGTFLFTLLFFVLVIAAFAFYLFTYHARALWFYIVCQIPIIIFFLTWFIQVLRDEKKADFSRTMTLNLITSFCMNLFSLGLKVLFY